MSNLKQVQARLSATAAAKPKKMKNGSQLFTDTDPSEPMVSFEDAKYDFDQLDSVLQLFTKVNPDHVATRGLSAPTLKELHVAVRKAIESLPIKKVDQMNKVFTKDFAKSYTQYLSDLQQLDEVLMGLDK